MKKIIKGCISAISVTAGIIAVSAAAYIPFVVSDARKRYNDDCDYLLILGGDIIGADTPSPQLFERMKKAAEYLNEHKDVIAVPCGACFRKLQKKSEAQIITDYLISQGIDPSRLHLEEKSTTTNENFIFGLEILENLTGKDRKELKIAFLSSTYHMHRAGLFARFNGIEDIRRVACKTPGKAFQRYAREYFVAFEPLTLKLKETFQKK